LRRDCDIVGRGLYDLVEEPDLGPPAATAVRTSAGSIIAISAVAVIETASFMAEA
jgi:hypothetical protein